jgi:uncharacterized membrane protein YphA (DoxX/SURF4 family)
MPMTSGGVRLQRAGLTIVRVAIGIFFLCEAFNKRHWIGDPTILARIFARWLVDAGPVSHWYLEHIAVPGARLFAVLVPIGELSVGLGLVAGVGLPWIALLACFMTLNYNVASGALFRQTVLTNGNVIPILGTTLGLAVSAMRRRQRPTRNSEPIAPSSTTAAM